MKKYETTKVYVHEEFSDFTLTYEKITYENWLWSARKWTKILEDVKKGKNFVPRGDLKIGFGDIAVTGGEGYCKQYSCDEETCKARHFDRSAIPDATCPLFHRKVDGIRICYAKPPTWPCVCPFTHFWIFVGEMRKPNYWDCLPTNEEIMRIRKSFSRETALKEAEIIYRAILEDCPDKKRAQEDGIIFID